MNNKLESRVDALLESDSGYGDFATTIAESAVTSDWECMAAKLSQVRQRVVGIPPTAVDVSTIHTLFKAQLGLGIIVACLDETKQAELIETAFLEPLRSQGNSKTLDKRLLLLELAYLDQHIKRTIRFHVYDEIQRLCQADPWSPAIRDYLLAWEMLRRGPDIAKATPTRKRQAPNVFVVASAKGGVGKSIVAAALLTYLAEEKLESTAIVDLDSSGPSTQFYFDIPGITKAIPLLPSHEPASNSKWCYSSFLDICEAASSSSSSPAELAEVINNSIYQLGREDNRAAVVLPDSLTFSAELDTLSIVEAGRVEILLALRTLLDTLSGATSTTGNRYKNVIIDFRAGLYGSNGIVFRSLCRKFPCSAIIVSSPRATDFTTCLYESTWLSAAGEFEWEGLVTNLVNMWPSTECSDFWSTVDRWADVWLSTAIAASLTKGEPSLSSGAQIYAWRIWSYLYHRGLDAVGKASSTIQALPDDDDIRYLTSAEATSARAAAINAVRPLELKALSESNWYRNHLKRHFDELYAARQRKSK